MNFVNFYKRFINKFNSITALFIDILKRSKKIFFEDFEFTSATKERFNSLETLFSLRQFYHISILNAKSKLKPTRENLKYLI